MTYSPLWGAIYDTIGTGYTGARREDPRIAAAIWAALGDSRLILNVGAGSGSYEPPDRRVVAVEPSPVMLAQRAATAAPALRGAAETLPFADGAFDAAMGVLTVHHWTDKHRGLAKCTDDAGGCPTSPGGSGGSSPRASRAPRRAAWSRAAACRPRCWRRCSARPS